MKFKIKRILAVMLVFCMMMGMMPMQAFAEAQTYVVTVSAEPAEGGTVYIDTPGVTEIPCDGTGQGHRVIAETNDGYKLVGWYKNDSFETNHYINTIYPSAQATQDYNYVAKFAKNINNIEITMPGKAGDTLSRTTVSVPDGAGYQIQSFDKLYVYESADSENYTFIGEDTQCVLAAGNVVRGNILMANPSSGYAYDSISKIAATVNGKSATVGDMYSKPYITFEYTVSASAPTPEVTTIDKVEVEITEPVAGEKPSYTATLPADAPYELIGSVGEYMKDGVKWSHGTTTLLPTSDSVRFEAGETYTVEVYLKAKDGYEFKRKTSGTNNFDDVEKWFNGKQDTVHTEVGEYYAGEDDVICVEMKFTVPAPTPEVTTTSVTVVKEWDVPEGTVLPDFIEVYLLANGQQVGDSNVRLTEDNDWTYTWEGLPAKDNDDIPIVYSVGEVEIEGYESTVGEAIETDTGIEIAITNTLIEEEPEVPETVDVAGTKTWVGDEEADRPESIIVNLLANDKVIKEAEVTARTQWTFYFDELPKYDEAGAEIEYSVEEEAVEGYTATYDGYNITNTLKEEPEDPEKPVYGIVVNNGKSYTGAGVEISAAEEGTKITLKANAASEGKEFDKWVVNNGTITLADATKAETTFDMPAERVQVTATYKDKAVTPPADDNDDNKDDANKPSDDKEDDKKPATDTEAPKTGDTSNIFMWFAVLFVSGFALVGFTLFGRKRRA